jgi:hypothetical protein
LEWAWHQETVAVVGFCHCLHLWTRLCVLGGVEDQIVVFAADHRYQSLVATFWLGIEEKTLWDSMRVYIKQAQVESSCTATSDNKWHPNAEVGVTSKR